MACDELPPLRSEEGKGVAFYGRYTRSPSGLLAFCSLLVSEV
jgi:hypothetical protein